jgi:transcriptional regulator with XRE-family HTH domain
MIAINEQRANSTIKLSLAKNITKLRKRMGISQDRLSKRADMSLSTIVNLENGKYDPTLKTLDKVANGLKVQLYILFMNAPCFNNKTLCDTMDKKVIK